MENVLHRNQLMADGSTTLWSYIRELIQDGKDKGYCDENLSERP